MHVPFIWESSLFLLSRSFDPMIKTSTYRKLDVPNMRQRGLTIQLACVLCVVCCVCEDFDVSVRAVADTFSERDLHSSSGGQVHWCHGGCEAQLRGEHAASLPPPSVPPGEVKKIDPVGDEGEGGCSDVHAA